MGAIGQLIRDLRAWTYLLMDHMETPSHLPSPQLPGVGGDRPRAEIAARSGDHPARVT